MSELARAARRAVNDALGDKATLKLMRAWDRIERIGFDVSRDGRRSAAAIRELKGVGRGRRCFIMGNGPSLNQVDLAPLRSEVTFGLNRAYLLFPKLGFQSTYLVAVNRLVIEQAGHDILDVGVPTFMSWHSRRYIRGPREPVYLPTGHAREFSRDPSRGLWEGATVTFAALQLAYYMGYHPVVLIGVDHSFATKGPAHKEVQSTGADPNHFDPNYFGKGFRWNLPDLETSEIAYAMARSAFEADGRTVLDATVGGKLTVFPKVDFEALVGTAKSQ